jgi:hypothetical protein
MEEDKEFLIVSFDVEADGKAPGISSMKSIGMCGITLDKQIVFKFERNLKPLEGATPDKETMEWWNKPEQKEALEYCSRNQEDPAVVFKELNEEILSLQKKWNLIPAAAPAAYDWQWPNWYFIKFVGTNPLGYTSKCMNSFLWGMKKKVHPSTWQFGKQFLDPKYPHTHKALDDALEQGMMFVKALNANVSGNEKILDEFEVELRGLDSWAESRGCYSTMRGYSESIMKKFKMLRKMLK